MKQETIVKHALEDWGAQARVPADLADRALRARSRRPHIKIALVGGTSALLAGTAAVALVSGGGAARPRPPAPAFEPVTLSADTTLRTDLGSAFPRRLVAAGHMAVSAYFTGRTVNANGKQTFERTWHLYNPSTGEYEPVPWAYLSVAPGMGRAAVLEGPLPAGRVGVYDMKTRKVVRWIRVDHPVGGAAWSPDGRRLLLTSYGSNPDAQGKPGTSSRTGYYVADSAAGPGAFHPMPAQRDNPGTRQDLGWSRDGALIWAPTATVPAKTFYSLEGGKRPAPAHEAEYEDEEAGLSPNGTLLPKFGPKPGPAVTVTNVVTGKKAAQLPIESARAWADDRRLFAIGCDPLKCKGIGEFRNRLLLVDLKGKITPLTGYRRSDREGSWVPVFTHR
ncbi:hypothetical protein [Actinomadura sp. WMMA1423]|uniref:hypothetical protein n=1 Tax=Actinomadura sp. WMMA1423 TaxID=2591108 RepID=UPI00114655EC|nr:hypothetical protein [Actinomadura sp. WMMA1423]